MGSSRDLLGLFTLFVVGVQLVWGQLVLDMGSTLSMNGIYYYLPSKPFSHGYTSVYAASASGSKSSRLGLVPITVVNSNAATSNLAALENTLNAFSTQDDVWGDGFLSAIILQGTSVQGFGGSTVNVRNRSTTLATIQASTKIPQGPYFISPIGDLYQPYRLYPDTEGAFTQPMGPFDAATATYAALPATVPGISSPGVAVPSRLYYTRTAAQPLAGVRTGIKDIFDINGLQTSDGNRAYYNLYPPRNATALPVQRLIDAGAILVGKMKTSQFANGEVATADWVDYHEPFNPRGDGYQDTSSSSSGPGSGIGSYPWLDLTLGSDTGGSIRGPSQVQGVYGNRPTRGLIPLTNTMPLAPELDTAGFLVRDPTIWTAAAKAMYQDALPFFPQFPPKLQTINFPLPNTTASDSTKAEANAILLAFLSKIEAFLKLKASPVNYTALWDQVKPNATLPPLSVLLNRTYPTLISKEQTKNVRDPFFADYAAMNDGRTPFVDPVPKARWAFGDSLPASELDVAVANKTLFQNFWETYILPAGDNRTAYCSQSIILYSSGVNILYRNTYLQPPRPPFGFDDSQISIFAEVPDFVVPLGSASYNSTVTNHTEVLPVSVDIIAARGCDGVIFSLVEALLQAGIITIPLAGQTITGGEILYKHK
ncbi:hypothetical protein XPA_010624 [Xanthoria parietina]